MNDPVKEFFVICFHFSFSFESSKSFDANRDPPLNTKSILSFNQKHVKKLKMGEIKNQINDNVIIFLL